MCAVKTLPFPLRCVYKNSNVVIYALSINGIAYRGNFCGEGKKSDIVEASRVGWNGRVMMDSDAVRIVTRGKRGKVLNNVRSMDKSKMHV